MIEITIRQKDSNVHTQFIIMRNGEVFGAENFRLAKKWRDQGLLGERAASFIDKITGAQTSSQLEAGGVLQIEI